jgi:organic radical activating enzyme
MDGEEDEYLRRDTTMFGTNEIVGKRFFKDAEKDQMLVTSMFMTLQGEGPFRGEPAFFIRLAKCNLDCQFCDTFFDDGDWLTFDEIEQRIEETIDQFYIDKKMDRPAWTRHAIKTTDLSEDSVVEYQLGSPMRKRMVLVMTGGEPMLQDNINPFLERMEQVFDKSQIESNGTQATAIPESTTLVCSPKCLEKKKVAVRYLKPRPEILERATCLKFVMEADQDSPYCDIPDWAHEWHAETGRAVFVSPMNVYNTVPLESKKFRLNSNTTSLKQRSEIDEVVSFWEPELLDMKANQINHEYAAQFCVKHGYILNLQIHLYCTMA